MHSIHSVGPSVNPASERLCSYIYTPCELFSLLFLCNSNLRSLILLGPVLTLFSFPFTMASQDDVDQRPSTVTENNPSLQHEIGEDLRGAPGTELGGESAGTPDGDPNHALPTIAEKDSDLESAPKDENLEVQSPCPISDPKSGPESQPEERVVEGQGPSIANIEKDFLPESHPEKQDLEDKRLSMATTKKDPSPEPELPTQHLEEHPLKPNQDPEKQSPGASTITIETDKILATQDLENQTPNNPETSAIPAREVFPETDLDQGIIGWDGQDDPDNPQNFPPSKKWGLLFLISAFTMISPLASSMFSPAIRYMAEDFHETNQSLLSFTVSVFLLGYAVCTHHSGTFFP